MSLPLDQIQGNVTPGFRKDHQAFLLFQWGSSRQQIQAARLWIRAIRPHISTALEVATFNRVYTLVKKRLPKGESRVLRSTWVNIGFSRRGLKKLISARAFKGFPDEFVRSPDRGAAEVDDIATRAAFEFGASVETLPDAIVIIGADTVEDLRSEIVRQLELATGLSLMLPPYIGRTLGDRREHFGFRDGLSQPDPSDPLDGWDWQGKPEQVVAPGEFILGHPREPSLDPTDPVELKEVKELPLLTANGSYLVFRKLKQHVHLFEEEVKQAITAINDTYTTDMSHGITGTKLLPGLTAEVMRSKLLGRWPSGVKLTVPGTPVPAYDPGQAYPTFEDIPRDLTTIKSSDFQADDYGRQCPFFAHIRKANPRTNPDVRSHRIIRRGITYGPAVKDRTKDDQQDRGIFFLGYQASIARQFEFIQQNWLNSSATVEPVTAQPPGPAKNAGQEVIVRTRPNSTTQDALQLWQQLGLEFIPFPPAGGAAFPVTARGSGYFFVPSIDGLKILGH